jgi:oxygen-independent coproporphyrinogen-3 oxidase
MVDKADTLAFTRHHEPPAPFPGNSAALYIHIPFCRHLCPFCPYNKIEYAPVIAANYIRALRAEIRRAGEKYGRLNIGSVYFGGGTPTVLLGELGGVMDDLRECFTMAGPVAIETTPADLTAEMATLTRYLGFGLVSLGVQSYQDRVLRHIGRPYDGAMAGRACSILKAAGFQTLNLDLMFALPGQTTDDLRRDLLEAISHEPQQITCYPLLTFPYASVDRWIARNRVVVPKHRQRWHMYCMLCETLAEHGYVRASVWSFIRNTTTAFSSVTRDRYLGFGAGAASYNGRTFTFNTFSVAAYNAAVEGSLFPTAIGMPVSARLERMFWLYWRLYETRVPKAAYRELFGRDLEGDFPGIFRMLRGFGFVETESEDALTLNTLGCHWVHLAQNLLALNDINTVWSAARATPFPNKICL